ncbi:MAG: hypothetical protein U1E27_08810, partial [Kiritimatiellia bacterium]|nr:hypothetical protein [Kiritimatiellia bacterium]
PLKRPSARSGMLNVGVKGEVTVSTVRDPTEDFVATLHQQVLELGGTTDWTLDSLIAWLDRQIDHRDIPFGESAEFLRKALRGLMAKFSITDVSLLALDRFRLRDRIEARIGQHRDGERKKAFQGFLLPDSLLTVTESFVINLKVMSYEPSHLYTGNYEFKKHYFGPKPGELEEVNSSGTLTEEFKCARFLDELPEVEIWVRNLARKNSSFRLQTSTDWFYPDFVCQLADGRILAVEYKGKHLYTTDDSEEKRAIGAVWASRSNGKCHFVMPTQDDFSIIEKAIRKK